MKNDEIPTIPDVSAARDNLFAHLKKHGDVTDSLWNDYAILCFTAGLALGMRETIRRQNNEIELLNREIAARQE